MGAVHRISAALVEEYQLCQISPVRLPHPVGPHDVLVIHGRVCVVSYLFVAVFGWVGLVAVIRILVGARGVVVARSHKSVGSGEILHSLVLLGGRR